MKRNPPQGCFKTGLPPDICGHCRYPELYRIAEEIARETAQKCNQRTQDVQSEMSYKAGFVLETVARILQESV